MPQLDSYFQLKDAYGETTIEHFDPNATARSLKFNSSWSGKGGGGSRPPIQIQPPHSGRDHDRDRDREHDFDRHRYRQYPYYDYNYLNNYPYLPYFYNMYTYSPYNLNYSQYIPTMNMFWDTINTSIQNFPEYPGLSDIDRMKKFIMDLPTFIPCNDSCKSFLKVYIQEQISNLDSICQNKKILVDFFQNLRHQFYIKFDYY